MWGNLTAQEEAVPNRFKYTGQQLDPVTQQYYLRARFYNPVIARFTQEDTYRGDGLNLYAYCVNNPVLYSDPTGNVSQCVKKDVLGQANPTRNTALAIYDPHFASEQRMQAGEIYRDAQGRWHDGETGRFVSVPSSRMSRPNTSTASATISADHTAELARKSPLEIGNYLNYDRLNGGTGTKLPSDLAAMYPQTRFRFTRRGEAGADVEFVGGVHPSNTSVYPGTQWPVNANYGDFKPNTPSGWRKLQKQIRNRGYDPNTVFLPYDPSTGELLF